MAEKVRLRDTVNPFARIEAAKPKEPVKEEPKKKKKKSSSWMDMPFDAMKYVGDYIRGVK